MVPLPTLEPGLCGPGRRVATGLRSGQQPLASRPELTAFRACLKAGERRAQEGCPPLFPLLHHPPLPPSEEVAHRALAGLNPIAQQQTPILDLGTPCFLSFK